MKLPDRVQRSRRKGARLPPNTLCCTRPAKWSNPYTTLEEFAARLDEHLVGDLPELLAYDHLACWCSLDKECHVDVILDRLRKVQDATGGGS